MSQAAPDSGVENLPTWNNAVNPTLAQLPAPNGPIVNAGTGINNLDTCEFIQIRITSYLPATVGPFDPGPFMDRWTIRFTSDQ